MFRKYRLSSVIIKVKWLFLCGLNIIKGSNLSDIPFGLRAKREWIREAKHSTKRKVYCFALIYLH